MLMTTALATLLLLQCSELCVAIKVPVVWNEGDSEVKNNGFNDEEFSVDVFKPDSLKQETVPVEYFQYTAKKPQFAVDVASFHGVPSPASHYKAYPVRPYTGKENPNLGKHRLQDPNREIFAPLQKYTQNKVNYNSQIHPIVSSYEVYHPYKVEEPALQKIYKDPVLDKIRNDLRDTSKRFQNYEKEAGKPDTESDEYSESPEETDRKKVPHRNIPARYEIHRPLRRPVYYRPLPRYPNRDQILNQRFRHPWNQNFVKIRPAHYKPLKNHLQKLRQHHALTYDDEQNEYPQVSLAEEIEEPSDGYDIYEKGKKKYVRLRNNLDESINQAIRESRPLVSQKLELQSNEEPSIDEDDEFVPVKSYAQVRKTETTKHLPKSAAFKDADTYEEIKNAPRLKEAVKTTKAQTVYTEEGYEDSAYDHAGEQKHASDHEAHGGFLKENEISGGKYKIPTVSASHDDESRSEQRDQLLHGEKWRNSEKDQSKENESDQYSEDEREQSSEADAYNNSPDYEDNSQRNKRQYESTEKKNNDTIIAKHDEDDKGANNTEHDVDKREANFKVPDIDLNSTLLTEDEILEIANDKIVIEDDLKLKYPYYFKNLATIYKDSPLRYAENLKFIPKKSKGGTEFYDSRSQIVCPEVDKKVDAIPAKLKKKGHPDSKDEDDTDSKGEQEDNVEEQPRLKGLGDKIDCFKAKYFGENPLDSPFFEEDIIANPEPVTKPNLLSYKLTKPKGLSLQENNVHFDFSDGLRKNNFDDVFDLISQIRNKEIALKDSVTKDNNELLQSLQLPLNISKQNNKFPQQSNVNLEIVKSTKSDEIPKLLIAKQNGTNPFTPFASSDKTLQYQSYQNIEDKIPTPIRTKRATPFVYEPYKIIRDGQVQESKKTTTTSNISPLIKQLQSSRVVDKVTKPEKENLKLNVSNTRTYKDIGRNDRVRSKNSKGDTDLSDAKFVDVNFDKRRGEPRYEFRVPNHKPEYTPVINKKSMSRQDYETKTKDINISDKSKPNSSDVQSAAASNSVQRAIASNSSSQKSEKQNTEPHMKEDDEDYEEYDDEYEEEQEENVKLKPITTTTTTTTTTKPIFRKRIRHTTTPEKPYKEQEIVTPSPKLSLVTRFRTTPAPKEIKINIPEKEKLKNYDDSDDVELSKYKEKKRKTTKSTLVTDTQRYGDDENSEGDTEDDMRKEEVDALIGIKHDMDDYMPLYEKERLKKIKDNRPDDSSEEEYEEEDESETDEDDDDEDEDNDDDEEDGDDDVAEEENDRNDENFRNNDEKIKKQALVVTTPEPTKRSLFRTTDAPLSTTETNRGKGDLKPRISKKKIEIHKELPVNNSAPHVTQFRQDIKEVEIIKEIPRKATTKKPKNNSQLLELYKDENLAKTINKLKDVEVFKENLDLTTGPKHGGNYRSAQLVELAEETSTVEPMHGGNLKIESQDELEQLDEDAETSQTEHKKSIELDSPPAKLHGGNLKSFKDYETSRKSTGRNAKLIELESTTENIPRARHGGNLKSIHNSRGRGVSKNERLTELSEHDKDDDDDSSSDTYSDSSRSYAGGKKAERPMHGGNYRSAKLIQADSEEATAQSIEENTRSSRRPSKEAKISAAVILNSFVQAAAAAQAPVLTTTPAYILDPSKRKYYYVDS